MWREVDDVGERDETRAARIALQRVEDNEPGHYKLLARVIDRPERADKLDVDDAARLGDVLDLVDAYVEEILR